MSKELKEIQVLLAKKSMAATRASHQKFVPGGEKAYGVKMPYLNVLATQYRTGGFQLAAELWEAGSLEEKVLAAKLLGKIAAKDPDHSLKLVEHFAQNIGNWAVCDAIGMQGLKPILKTHRREIFVLAKKFNRSPDPWQRRLSLVLVEWYTRKKELHPEIKKLVTSLADDKEYYVKKAIAWINKNFEKGK